MRHFDNTLNNLLCNDRLLDNELDWNLMSERHDNLSIFDGHLMDLNDFFNNSVSKYLNWYLSDDLSWNSSLNFDFLRHLFLNNQFNWLLSFDDLNFLNILNDRSINIDFLYDLHFSNDRNLSDDLHNLQAGYFDSHNSLDDSWNFNDLFNNPWNWNDFLNNSLDLDDSWYLYNFLYDFVHEDSLSPYNFPFNNDRNWDFNPDFLYDLLSDGDNSGNFLVDYSGLGLNVRHLHFDVDGFFFLEIQGYNFLDFQVFGDQDFMSVWFLDNDLNFLDDFFPITLDEMGHFDENFLFDFSNDFFFLKYWHFNYSLFNDFVRNDFLNDLSNIDFTLFSVGDEARNLPVKINSLSVSDHMRHLSFNFNVSVPFEDFLIDDLNLFDSVSCLSDVDWLLDYLLDFDVLFLPRDLYWLFDLNILSPFNDNLLVAFDFNHFLFI